MESESEKYIRLEAELARKLLEADPDRRAELYTEIYEKLYSSYPEEKRRELCEHYLSGATFSAGYVGKFLPRRAKVLDIGSGFGHVAAILARRGHEVVGIDINRTHLKEAGSLYGEIEGLTFQYMNAAALRFPDNSFDAATSRSVYEHIHPDDVSAHLSEVKRVLKPGGVYVIFTTISTGRRGDICGYARDPRLRAQKGLHINEGSWKEIRKAVLGAGFKAYSNMIPRRLELSFPGPPFLVPVSLKAALEPLISKSKFMLRLFQMSEALVVARKP